MNVKFKVIIDGLHKKYEKLTSCTEYDIKSIPQKEGNGVYLLKLNGKPLYAGRTKRNFQKRINDHIGNSDKKGDYCSIAFRLARKKVKQFEKANYKKGFREMAMKNPEFKKVYNLQKERVCKMKVQYVVEKDPLTQALLEIYAQVESNCILKDFDTH